MLLVGLAALAKVTVAIFFFFFCGGGGGLFVAAAAVVDDVDFVITRHKEEAMQTVPTWCQHVLTREATVYRPSRQLSSQGMVTHVVSRG